MVQDKDKLKINVWVLGFLEYFSSMFIIPFFLITLFTFVKILNYLISSPEGIVTGPTLVSFIFSFSLVLLFLVYPKLNKYLTFEWDTNFKEFPEKLHSILIIILILMMILVYFISIHYYESFNIDVLLSGLIQ